LDAIAGFNVEIRSGNDGVMSQTLLRAGYAIGYNPAMKIYHQHDTKYRTIYKISQRKAMQRFAVENGIAFKSCFPLFKNLISAPFDVIKHPEMFHADKSKAKVYAVFTWIRVIDAFAALATFLQLYFKAILRNILP
jgi:hypothetical protein